MTTANICILLAIVVYLAGMLAIGFMHSKSTTSEEFFLGGRKLGPIVTAMSTEASDMSSWLLMGLPGVAYVSGLADAAWTAIGLALGTYFNWLIVAKRLRIYSTRLNAITVPDFIAKRFHDVSGLIEGIGGIIVIIFFVPYTASGFAACGKLFNSLFGMNYMTAMLISAVVIVGYCTAGGFMAASLTSLIQSIVMTVALITILIFGTSAAGGFSAVIANAKEIPGYLSLTSLGNVATGTASSYGFITILSTMAWGLGYFAMPHILNHFMATEDENKLATSRRVATVWVVISMAIAVFIGIMGYAVSKTGSIDTFETSSQAEAIIVKLASLLSTYGVVPAIIAGVVLAGILSSTMSTADVQLLCAASAISQNILQGVLRMKISDRQQIVIARATVICVAVLGVLFARDPNSSVFTIVSFAWAGFGATFGPVMLFGLFWKRANKSGALAAMVAGGIVVFAWKYLVRPMGGAWNIYELLPAFIVACVFMVVVSLLTAKPEKAVVAEFEAVQAAVK